MARANRAVLQADLAVAEQVIGADEDIDVLGTRCADQAFRLLSLQAPVGRDLRLVVTGIQVAEKIERMGGLACHIAEIAWRPGAAAQPHIRESRVVRHRAGPPIPWLWLLQTPRRPS